MQAAKIRKQRKNYLELLPTDALTNILFFLDETDRWDSIVKMPELQEALLKHNYNMKTLIAEQAVALVREDKDLNSAAALIEKFKGLLTNRFCRALANWAEHAVVSEKTSEIAEKIHAYAKEIDPSRIVGGLMGQATEMTYDYVDSDDDNAPDAYHWEEPMQEYNNIIWVRFGRITVHYKLAPFYFINEYEGELKRGSVELNVYAQIRGKLITGRNFFTWDPSLIMISSSDSSIIQVGNIESSEENIVFATAIGLVSYVGRSSHATAVAHCVKGAFFGMVEKAALALRLCGRCFQTLKAKQESKDPELMEVLC